MEKCKCCGAILKGTETIKQLDEIPGQESVKRAIEICLAGNHSIGIININGYGNEFATWLSNHDISVWVTNKCPCGNYGDIYAECKCSVTKIQQWNQRKEVKQCLHADIIIESVRPRQRDLVSPYPCEPEQDMMKRVERSKHVVIKDKALDEQSKYLLKMAIDKLGLSYEDIAIVRKVAETIARLDGLSEIKVQHISEAIQYRYQVNL